MGEVFKIIITGPFDAGKTAFIRTISEIEPVTTEKTLAYDEGGVQKSSTTVAMDFGKLTIDPEENIVLHLYGTPGQKRFDFMWEILSKGIIGCIFMLDSSTPRSVKELIPIITYFKELSDVPCLIAANKQDLPCACSIGEIKKAMAPILPDIPILPLVALDKNSVKKVLLKLMELVMERAI